MPTETIILTAATAAASVGSAVYSNKQAKEAAEYQNSQQKLAYEKTLAASREQAAIAAMEKRRQLQDRYDAYRGALEVSAAERGVSNSRSTQALVSSLGIQAARESARISLEERLNMQNLSINAMPQWQVAPQNSMLLSGIQGGLQGLSMGMSLMQGQQGLDINRAVARAQGIQV